MTGIEKIRSMSVEEFAFMLNSLSECPGELNFKEEKCKYTCIKCWENALNSEVDEC